MNDHLSHFVPLNESKLVLLLLLPLATAVRAAAYDKSALSKSAKSGDLPEAYFKRLGFLLNEQPDKALQVFLEVVEVDTETVEMHMVLGN